MVPSCPFLSWAGGPWWLVGVSGTRDIWSKFKRMLEILGNDLSFRFLSFEDS